MNLIERITAELLTDDNNTDKDSARILARYHGASDEAKKDIDDIFISLCGYSLATLINN